MRVDELEKEVNEKDREIKRMKTNYREKIVEIEEQLEVKSTEVETLKVTPCLSFIITASRENFSLKGNFCQVKLSANSLQKSRLVEITKLLLCPFPSC